ncbi:chorismate--pyruvate lyase family protein [Pseudoduganella albidiflava]|uniref:Probable chorismate pyruvate-lyase n=1 Tax=Pseudoduganella albidiflava TaxID=321983 RepID=A0A411WTH0_9BURK|nr:chorismate lyase [Pseudoduganella albidiflava]QBH99786.1 chorismate lyase [Pseudoduganella albidiflava]GGY63049.1 putative chorismate pyruvate-lyase [Pseudoduganella albidiflava]
MRERSLRRANWYRHVLAVNAPVALACWLTSGGSLTARLKAHAGTFRVQVLRQRPAQCLADESGALGLPRIGNGRGRCWEREVLLRCDNTPVVFAHTVVPMSADAADWPLFSALGERSLGTTLFGDPMVARGPLEYARLRGSHPLARRARAALAGQGIAVPDELLLYARRCLYRRRQGTLLVTEVFLPQVAALVPKTSNTR